MSLYSEWLAAKEAERQAVEQRRQIEDRLITAHGLPKVHEGSKTLDAEGYKVKVTYRMNRRIDSDALQEIAAENGLSEHLGSLFRWKPEINARAWKDAGEEITRPLLDAITTKPGRPSFSIEPKQSDKEED